MSKKQTDLKTANNFQLLLLDGVFKKPTAPVVGLNEAHRAVSPLSPSRGLCSCPFGKRCPTRGARGSGQLHVHRFG